MSEQSDTPIWWRCDTHGPGTRTAWGCPECVRELRTSLATATRERDEARAEGVEQARLLGISGSREAALLAKVDAITRERDEALAELETERMRLTACGVVAMANTPESAARVRDILPKHFSASLHSVMGAVDREMGLRAEVEMLRSALRAMMEIHGVRQAHVRPDSGISQSWVDVSEIARKALAATEAKP